MARKHPDGDLATHKSPAAASGPGGISRRVTEGIRHGCSTARARREVVSPPLGSTPRETRALCYSPEIHRTSRLGGGRPREAPSSPGWGAIAPTGRPEGPSWLETGRRKSPAASGTRGPPRLLPTRRLQRPSVCSTWSGLRAEPQAGASGCAGRSAAPRAGEVFGAEGSLPQKSKRAKAGRAADAGSARALLEGPSPLSARSATTARGWRGWHPRSHGVVRPSIVVSGTLSLPGTCRPQSHMVSTCQSLPIGHIQRMNLPHPQLPSGTTADPRPSPQATSCSPGEHVLHRAPLCPLLQAPPWHNAVTRLVGPVVPHHARSLAPCAPPKPHQHPPILHLASSQQQPPTRIMSRHCPPHPQQGTEPQTPALSPPPARGWVTSRQGAGKGNGGLWRGRGLLGSGRMRMEDEGQDSTRMLQQGVDCGGHPYGVRVPGSPGSRGAAGDGGVCGEQGGRGHPSRREGPQGRGPGG